MTSLNDINRTVRNILSTERIGVPVFVRCIFCETPRVNDPTIVLAQLAGIVRHWLRQDCECVLATGQAESGPVNLALKCRQGASALLSFAKGESGLKLIILGNHGAIYFDEVYDGWAYDSVTTTGETNSITAHQNQFLDAVRRSLRSGKPEPILAEPPL